MHKGFGKIRLASKLGSLFSKKPVDCFWQYIRTWHNFKKKEKGNLISAKNLLKGDTILRGWRYNGEPCVGSAFGNWTS